MKLAMRALARLFAVVLVAAGCAGAEGQRAQELLAQAQAAEAQVRSASYEAEVTITSEGQALTLALDGAAYLKGKHAGDQVLNVRASGPFAGFGFQFVKLGGQAYMRSDGRWQQVPLPAGVQQQGLGSAAFLELAQYVEDVSVVEGELVNGEPTARIAGRIDTEGLVKALAGLEDFSQFAGGAAPQLDQLAEHLGDTHAVIAVSERTHLVRGAVVDLTIEQEGKRVAVQLVYRLRSVNRPVRIPTPA